MKESRKKAIIGIFIVAIMVSSGVGLFYGSTTDEAGDSFEYRGLTVIPTQQGWLVKGENLKVRSLFNPKNLEEIDVQRFPYSLVAGKQKMYISIDPNDNLRIFLNELNNVLIPSGIRSFIVVACFDEAEGCEEMPLKTCEDAGATTYVMEVRENEEENSVEFLDNCVKIEGSHTWLGQATAKMALMNYYTE